MFQQSSVFLERKPWDFRLLKIHIPWRKIKVNAPKVSLFAIFCSCFYRNQFFSTTFTLQKENFEISKNSHHRELWWRKNFVKYLCSISFGLHDIDIDTHKFYKWAKKEEGTSTIRFLFLSIDDYERSISLISKACNGIKSVDGSTKLHAAFPSTPNKLTVRSTSCFCRNCFGTSFKPETACDVWRMLDL